jgi:hypothetical protein
VCRRYVRRNPTNWKDIDTSMFHRNENNEPVGRESTINSPIAPGVNGACTVVSQ